MNAIRAALYAKLTGDATLTGLLATPTAIYHRRAPQTVATPFVIFHKQDGRPVWTFADYLQDDVWLIKAVDRANSSSGAEDIAARIDQVLNDADLTITNTHHSYLRRESDIDYVEDDGASEYVHVGGLYRLVSEPNPA